MKRNIVMLLGAILLIGMMDSCKKKKKVIDFPVDRSDTTSLPSAIPALAISLDFTSPPMQIDTFATKVEEVIAPYGISSNQITSVTLTGLEIVLENSPGQTFNFIKDSATALKVYVDSFNGTAPLMVASIQSRPLNATKMTLNVEPVDIKNFFRSQYMKLLVGFRTQENEGMNAATKFRVNYEFRIVADPNL